MRLVPVKATGLSTQLMVAFVYCSQISKEEQEILKTNRENELWSRLKNMETGGIVSD